MAAMTRQITVIGHGEATAAPDIATIRLGVQTRAVTARQALSENTTQMQALIDRLKELGVADRDLRTSTISIGQYYSPRGDEPSGYEASNAVIVAIRALDRFGELLDTIVDAGANNVSSINFLLDDPSALEQQARDSAINNARDRARSMAQAAGLALGSIISISETMGGPIPLAEAGPMRRMRATAAVPIQSGELSIQAQVQITFELQ